MIYGKKEIKTKDNIIAIEAVIKIIKIIFHNNINYKIIIVINYIKNKEKYENSIYLT